MGTGYTLECKRCGYTFSANLGIGFLFPSVYGKTMEAGRKGKLGKEVRQFLEEHPDGVLDCDSVILQCLDCGALECGPDLTMYVPGEEGPAPSVGNWSVAFPFPDASYVIPRDLENYRRIGTYDHKCRKCRGKMRIIKQGEIERMISKPGADGELAEILCPKCRETLWLKGILMWD